MKTRLLSVLALALFIAMILFAATGKGQILDSGSPTAFFTYSPTAPMPGDVIVFDASSSYATSGNIIIYMWDFGDGTVQTSSPIVTHSYLLDGTYTVQLTITDNNGATDSAAAVVQVSTVVFFRVVFAGTLIPLANAKVTAYYKNAGSWIPIPAGPSSIEIKYDNMTAPNLASTSAEKYRNPGYTASILRQGASNIGFDIKPGCWEVYFKIEWASYVTYWPNETTHVYSYKNGAVETHNYLSGHQAEWDPSASQYVIEVNDIPGHGVSPTESHPIIVGLFCPPPPVQYYLTVRTDPSSLSTIPGQGWYNKGTNVVLTAPNYENTTSTSRYRFSYWDIDGAPQSIGLNPITVAMLANHTATAHYVLQYPVAFSQTGLSSDATGTVVTVNGTAKTYSDLPYTYWADSSDIITYTYGSTVSTGVSGKQYRSSSVTGPSSPIIVSSSTIVCGNYVVQYLITFAQTGLDATATGTVVTVNSTSKTYAQLPYSFWVDSGSYITYSCNPTISSSTTGKQFILTGVTGSSSPITITSLTNVTGNYKTQYRLTVTSPYDSPTPNSGWFDSGSNITESVTSPVLGGAGTQYVCTGWTGTGNVPSSGSGTFVVFTITTASSITWNWKTQYQVTFSQSGVGSDFLGTVVTVDSVNHGVSSLPFSTWYDNGSTHSFSYASPLIVGSNQYVWSSTSGLSTLQSGTLTATASGSVIGNYLVQNQVTFDQAGVNPDFTGTVVTIDSVAYTKTQLPVMFSWSVGSNHSFAFQSPLIVGSTTTQYIWTSTTGLTSLQSGSITITTYGSIIGNYKTQYYLTVSSPHGSPTPLNGWFDSGSIITESVSSPVSGGPNLQYACTGWTGSGSVPVTGVSSSFTFTITTASSVTWNWKTQYQVTFSQTGVGPDFTGTVVTIDSNPYTTSLLPASFWWDNGSPHTFSYNSPLIVNATRQYNWSSTTGLTTLQSGTLTITGSGSVTGNYATETMLQVTFTQTGLASDFTGTVLTIDGTDYGVTDLPVSFWWSTSSVHTFSYQSPLLVTANVKQYVWASTSGLTTSQGGSITVTSSGTVTATYGIQYYLTLVTNPPGIASPTGAGWYNADSNATIGTPGYVDIISGSSRYRFNGWTTTNMSKIADPSRTPTTTIVNEDPTITANYVVQYFVTINQTGVGSDFTGTIVTIDTIDYNYSGLPTTLVWDNGTIHTFEFKSPLVVTPSAKRYVWTGTTGLSTIQSDTITATTFGNIVGSYQIQYYVTVGTNPPGIATIPGEGWYNQSAVATLTAPVVPSYTFDRWYINGVPQGAGTNPLVVTMNAPYTTQANYNASTPYMLTITTTLGGTTNPTPASYNYSSGQTVLVTGIPNSGYVLDHWEYDGTNVSASNNPYTVTMNANHSLKAVFLPAPLPPTVSISPMIQTINLGQSLQFTSTVTGGKSPYQYQWYLDGAPVSGATASTWMFTPTSYGLHFVHLKVTDALNNTVFSADASITVIGPPPVGGYAVSLSRQRITIGIAAYAFLLGMLSVVLVSTKRKRK